jgi:hypothetical protein
MYVCLLFYSNGIVVIINHPLGRKVRRKAQPVNPEQGDQIRRMFAFWAIDRLLGDCLLWALFKTKK